MVEMSQEQHPDHQQAVQQAGGDATRPREVVPPSYGKKSRLTRLLKPYNKFITLITPHNAQPYLKSTFEEVWEYAGAELTKASENRFRSPNDYTQELFRTWQICRSNFLPYNTYSDTKMFR